MKKLKEAGIFAVIGFLFGTLGQIALWRYKVDLILNGYKYLPFAISPLFAFLASWLMVGKVSFKYFHETDDNGNKAYNAFILVFIFMLIISLGISFEAISEA